MHFYQPFSVCPALDPLGFSAFVQAFVCMYGYSIYPLVGICQVLFIGRFLTYRKSYLYAYHSKKFSDTKGYEHCEHATSYYSDYCFSFVCPSGISGEPSGHNKSNQYSGECRDNAHRNTRKNYKQKRYYPTTNK